LARNCPDVAIVLDVISGYDNQDPSSVKAPRKFEYFEETLKARGNRNRIGVLRDYFLESVSDEVRALFEKAINGLRSLGFELVDAQIPNVENSGAIWAPIRFSEASAYHEAWLKERTNDYGSDVRSKLERGKEYSAIQYVLAKRKAIEFKAQMGKVFDQFEALISPTVPVQAPKIGEATVSIGSKEIDVYSALVRQTQPFNVSGFPSVSIPMGLSLNDHLPLGLQIAGRPFEEATILGIGSAYEQKYGLK
jgi:aspartyl-tRNA(Asn)/glutamyl-tRNA(Gln) amidotransferase subunit A